MPAFIMTSEANAAGRSVLPRALRPPERKVWPTAQWARSPGGLSWAVLVTVPRETSNQVRPAGCKWRVES